MSVPRDTQKCEQEDRTAVSGSERIAPYRLDQSRVEAYTMGFSQTFFLYPVPSAAAQTAPNGVKERASFCLVFRSLNTSHRMFSMGYRRAKSTQGKHFQKRIFFGKQLRDHYPRNLTELDPFPDSLSNLQVRVQCLTAADTDRQSYRPGTTLSFLFAKHIRFEQSISCPRPVIISRGEENINDQTIFFDAKNRDWSAAIIENGLLTVTPTHFCGFWLED